jgi:hypothetical protein
MPRVQRDHNPKGEIVNLDELIARLQEIRAGEVMNLKLVAVCGLKEFEVIFANVWPENPKTGPKHVLLTLSSNPVE